LRVAYASAAIQKGTTAVDENFHRVSKGGSQNALCAARASFDVSVGQFSIHYGHVIASGNGSQPATPPQLPIMLQSSGERLFGFACRNSRFASGFCALRDEQLQLPQRSQSRSKLWISRGRQGEHKYIESLVRGRKRVSRCHVQHCFFDSSSVTMGA
jgi:hypothetical protein